MRTLTLFLFILLCSCAARVELPAHIHENAPRASRAALPAPGSRSHDLGGQLGSALEQHHYAEGSIVQTKQPSLSFSVVSERPDPAGDDTLNLFFLPRSLISGWSPYVTNELRLVNRNDPAFRYPAGRRSSTFFEIQPSHWEKPKGLIIYHTSIMLFTSVERRFVKKMNSLGWNVLVAYPSDRIFRLQVPLPLQDGSLPPGAAQRLARSFDAHYAEQAYATRTALAHLEAAFPDLLGGKRVLMGTSVGTFGLAAEARFLRDWDACIFASPGTNLLTALSSGATDIFAHSLEALKKFHPSETSAIDREDLHQLYHDLYEDAATLTRFDALHQAPALKSRKILLLQGSLDQVIPSHQPNDLHRALGHPERWSYPLGHYLMAIQLGFSAEHIDRWICEN